MICHHIAHGAFGIGEVALALAGGQQFLQFLLALRSEAALDYRR